MFVIASYIVASTDDDLFILQGTGDIYLGERCVCLHAAFYAAVCTEEHSRRLVGHHATGGHSTGGHSTGGHSTGGHSTGGPAHPQTSTLRYVHPASLATGTTRPTHLDYIENTCFKIHTFTATGVWLATYDTSTDMFTNSQLREDIFYCATRDVRDNTVRFNGSYVAVCDHDIIGFATGAAYTFVACLLVLSVIAVVTFANNCCKRSATARVQMPLV